MEPLHDNAFTLLQARRTALVKPKRGKAFPPEPQVTRKYRRQRAVQEKRSRTRRRSSALSSVADDKRVSAVLEEEPPPYQDQVPAEEPAEDHTEALQHFADAVLYSNFVRFDRGRVRNEALQHSDDDDDSGRDTETDDEPVEEQSAPPDEQQEPALSPSQKRQLYNRRRSSFQLGDTEATIGTLGAAHAEGAMIQNRRRSSGGGAAPGTSVGSFQPGKFGMGGLTPSGSFAGAAGHNFGSFGGSFGGKLGLQLKQRIQLGLGAILQQHSQLPSRIASQLPSQRASKAASQAASQAGSNAASKVASVAASKQASKQVSRAPSKQGSFLNIVGGGPVAGPTLLSGGGALVLSWSHGIGLIITS